MSAGSGSGGSMVPSRFVAHRERMSLKLDGSALIKRDL